MKLVRKCRLLMEFWLLISILAILTACGASEKSEKGMMEDLNNSELVEVGMLFLFVYMYYLIVFYEQDEYNKILMKI